MLLTNDLREDGFGAQYQSIIWTILFTEVKGDTFLYSDIVHMANDTGDNERFLKDAVNTMNIKENYPAVDSVGGVTIYAPKWPYFYKEIERDMERYHESHSFEKIKRLYYRNKKNPYDTSYTNIAVHIRRPKEFDTRKEGTDTPDSYYIHCMDAAQALFSKSGKKLLFHIYSQGSIASFQEYTKFPVEFHLEDDTFTTFNGMVFADVLILSESSYSYTAALLSNGKIVYKPFWHPPRSDWLILQNA